MGNIKRGKNRYVVLTAVTSGNMRTAFANLGASTIVFYSKASATTGGVSSTQAYSNDDDFPSYASAAVGDVVEIGGLAAEVDVAVLGAANVGGPTGPWSAWQNIPITTGASTFSLPGVTLPANNNNIDLRRNGGELTNKTSTPGPPGTITFGAGEPAITQQEVDNDAATPNGQPKTLQYRTFQ